MQILHGSELRQKKRSLHLKKLTRNIERMRPRKFGEYKMNRKNLTNRVDREKMNNNKQNAEKVETFHLSWQMKVKKLNISQKHKRRTETC